MKEREGLAKAIRIIKMDKKNKKLNNEYSKYTLSLVLQ